MKKLLFVLFTMSVSIAGVFQGPTAITLKWSYDTNNPPDVFKIYANPNINTPVTNWSLFAVVPGTNLSYTVIVNPGKQFYCVTASNFWGESGPSNITNTPVVPSDPTGININK